ncbi:clarin-3 [Chanos chanos]|uniref:Clarin-3 n=1 Tax=Chanos chanos TaxID=29144 RepID=A0A6J2VIU8_CHACN|nr:clarin-3 [Chanos chanos]
MPSVLKVFHFSCGALLNAIGVCILGYGMSTYWVQSEMQCSTFSTENFNGSATVKLGLFNGSMDRRSCPGFDTRESVSVLKALTEIGASQIALHALAVGLLILALVCSAGSILVTLYNSISNPYETYLGPLAVYACSGLSACLSLLAIVLFVSNVYVGGVASKLVKDVPVDLYVRNENIHLQVGYYLVLPYIVVNLLAILVIFLYVHAAYTHRREMEKPTEDAPKEIMMY